MTSPHSIPSPIARISVAILRLSSDINVQVLMTSKDVLCSSFQITIYPFSCLFNELERCFVANFCGVLLRKCELGLGCREEGFEVVDEGGDAFDEAFEFGSVMLSKIG